MNSIITIANIDIRQDMDGRYSLNDLHRASGGEKRHGPSYWLTNAQTRALIKELATTGIPVVTVEGAGGGTYVAKELVYAYAMWISPAFHLKVIRAYDTLMSSMQASLASSAFYAKVPKTLPDALRLAADESERADQAEAALAIAAPKAEIFERIADASGSMTLRETATTLRYPERKMILWMQQNGWLYRRPGRGTLLGYAEQIKAGHLDHKVTLIHNERTGEDETREAVRVTPLGLTVLAKRLGCDDYRQDMPAGVLVRGGPGGYASRRE